MMRSCLRLDFKSCSPDPETNSKINNHNFHDFLMNEKNFYKYSSFFWSKNNLIAKFVKIRSCGWLLDPVSKMIVYLTILRFLWHFCKRRL